jgi:hypothetical protein
MMRSTECSVFPPSQISRNVRLDEIFAGFDFIEVFARAHGFGRVAYVAGTLVPVAANLIDRDLGEV